MEMKDQTSKKMKDKKEDNAFWQVFMLVLILGLTLSCHKGFKNDLYLEMCIVFLNERNGSFREMKKLSFF